MKNILLAITITALCGLMTSCTTVTEIDQKTKATTEVTRFMGIPLTTKTTSTRPKY